MLSKFRNYYDFFGFDSEKIAIFLEFGIFYCVQVNFRLKYCGVKMSISYFTFSH